MSSSSSSNNNAEAKELNGPVVVRYHALITPENSYDIRNSRYRSIEYILLDCLQKPLLFDSVKYYREEAPFAPIAFITPDGLIGVKTGSREPKYYDTGYRYNLVPVKCQVRKISNVPLDMLDTWSEDIKLQNKTLQENADIPIPRYEQTELPMINEWVGRISSAVDTRTIIYDILHTTNEDKLLHWYDCTSGKELFNPMLTQWKNHLIATFEPRWCWSHDCAICHSFIRVPRGIYTIGQPVGNVEAASARYQIREINDVLDVIGESTDALMRTAQLSDLAYMSSNPDLMKALSEKKKRDEENRL